MPSAPRRSPPARRASIALTKRLFDEAGTNTLEQQLELEAELQTEAAATEDFREGVAAFVEKRAVEFRGT